MAETTTVRLQRCLDRLQAGDAAARSELLEAARRRLLHLARKMFRAWPRVKDWDDTDDVLQNAMLRLWRALEAVCPSSLRDFFQLASLQVRRELIDLSRHYFGPRGVAARLLSAQGGSSAPGYNVPDEDSEPSHVEAWTEFHETAAMLPAAEREVFDLLWYQGLTQEEAAAVLGVKVGAVERRWYRAKLRLHKALDGKIPPL